MNSAISALISAERTRNTSTALSLGSLVSFFRRARFAALGHGSFNANANCLNLTSSGQASTLPYGRRREPRFTQHAISPGIPTFERSPIACSTKSRTSAASCSTPDNFILVLDEHEQRPALLTEATRSMYRTIERRRHLIEPPFHIESHRYQTVQAADWIAGLVGRLGAIWADPQAFPQNDVFRRHFEHRLHHISRRSGVRTDSRR